MASPFFAILAFAFFLTLLFVYSKRYYKKTSFDLQQTLGITATFSSLIFGLLMGFTYTGLSTRYDQIKQAILREVSNLQLIYIMSKGLLNSEDVKKALKTYIKSVIEDEWPALAQGKHSVSTELIYQRLNRSIINMALVNPNEPVTGSILAHIASEERKLRLEYDQTNNFYFILVVLSGLMALVSFWFINVGDFLIQTVIDFGVISIFLVSLYLLYALSHPFYKSGISLSVQPYIDLYNYIEEIDKI